MTLARESQSKLLILNEVDNIAVLTADSVAGEILDGIKLIASKNITVGDKIALVDLSPGDKVFKYGFPIGTISQSVQKGEWIHTHNLKSDYLPAHEISKGDE